MLYYNYYRYNATVQACFCGLAVNHPQWVLSRNLYWPGLGSVPWYAKLIVAGLLLCMF